MNSKKKADLSFIPQKRSDPAKAIEELHPFRGICGDYLDRDAILPRKLIQIID